VAVASRAESWRQGVNAELAATWLPGLATLLVVIALGAAGGGMRPTVWRLVTLALLAIIAATLLARERVELFGRELLALGLLGALAAWSALSAVWSITPPASTLEAGGVQDAGEPGGTATKTWVVPASTQGHVTGGGQITPAGDRVTFGFNARNEHGRLHGECNVVDGLTKRQIKCFDVTSLVVSGNQAWIYGHALDKGTLTNTNYVIYVQDNGEPGIGRDTFSILTATGYSKSGILTAGNIQVHRH
jgi:hypothetical protein